MNQVALVSPYTVAKPNGYLPLTIGGQLRLVAGGPFEARPQGYLGVKMAKEIQAPCDISVPTVDFQTPDIQDARMALIKLVPALIEGTPIYVGCMAGRGRTGLFMGLLARLANPALTGNQARDYVRAHYYSHAIETPAQERYVQDFPLGDLSRYLLHYQSLKRRYR